MKQFIKTIFNLYDKEELNKVACTNYLQGYEDYDTKRNGKTKKGE